MTNYTSWHPGSFAWEAALENRIEKYEYISLWDDNDMLDLTGLKAALLNGYVVSFASYYSKDPVYGTRDWIMEGEAMIKGMKKIPDRGVSGHEMTIVGFDDSVKVDYGIHPVTKQRQYGYGALKIVGEQKTFHLNFNHPIQSSSIKEGFMVEKKMKGVSGYTTSAFEVSYSQSSDRKKITLNPPAGKYENGSYYSLDLRRIQPGIQSDGGNFLTGQKAFDFYVPGY